MLQRRKAESKNKGKKDSAHHARQVGEPTEKPLPFRSTKARKKAIGYVCIDEDWLEAHPEDDTAEKIRDWSCQDEEAERKIKSENDPEQQSEDDSDSSSSGSDTDATSWYAIPFVDFRVF